jgi:hypothetical protein
MESRERRRIRRGKEFDHLFPSPSVEDKTIKGSASVEDTMALIQKTVPLTLWHTEKIAKVLKGKTLYETCRNIWQFVYDHIQYKRDKDGVEQVRSPRRTWWERTSGVDCDCYTEFISSILLNLDIPHLARVTKYPKKYPQVPRWQHVYPIVPKAGREDKDMRDRDDYIVLDCVKDDFDDEEPYLERKDFSMRLDYLDGFENEETAQDDTGYIEPDTVDLADLAAVYDEEEMGNIFKKVGGAVKKAAKAVKQTAKKVGDKVGDGIRFLNRYTNPATILLRNGFLLAMKINLMNVAGRLRYAYLSDAQAQAKGMNLNELKKLRSIKDRAETVYWQAGGKKENLKKAILKGKGNKDKKVPLSGFEDEINGLGSVYADYDEYKIIHSDEGDLQGLGELASGTALAAATSAVAAIAGALKQVKGLFNKGGSDEKSFQSETENAGSASSAPSTIPEDEDAFNYDESASSHSPVVSQITTAATAPVVKTATSLLTQASSSGNASPGARDEDTNQSLVTNTENASTSSEQNMASREVRATGNGGSDLQTETSNSKPEGLMQKTSAWVKANPGKSLLIAGSVVAAGYLLMNRSKSDKAAAGLDGLPRKVKRKSKKKHKKRKTSRKMKVKRQILL